MSTWRKLTSSRAFVVDDDHRILLVRHVDSNNGGSFWVLPGGGIDPHENARAAAEREVAEETGLSVRAERLVYVVDSVEPQSSQTVYTFYFLARVPAGSAPVLGHDPEFPGEAQILKDVRFFTRAELAAEPRVYPTVLRREFWDLFAAGFRDHDPYRLWPENGDF